MSRRYKYYLKILFLFIFLCPSFSNAETFGIVYKATVPVYKLIGEQFKREMESNGHRVINITFDKNNRKKSIANIIDSNCDFFFSIGGPASRALKNSGKKGIFTMVVNPVDAKLISKEGLPIGQLTGVLISVDPKSQFKVLKQIYPNRAIAACIYNPSISRYMVENFQKISGDYGFEIHESIVADQSDVPPILPNLIGKSDFILSLVDNTVYNKRNIGLILRFSLTNKIPLVGFSPQQCKAGSLISFYCDYSKLGNQSAALMEKVMETEDISQVKVESPNSVKYAVNKSSAKVLKLELPSNVLSRADKVYGK